MNYTQNARDYLLNKHEIEDVAIYHLTKAKDTVQIVIEPPSGSHEELEGEIANREIVDVRGYVVGDDFIGVSIPKCVEDGTPKIIFIEDRNKEKDPDKRQYIGLRVFDWQQYTIKYGRKNLATMAVKETAEKIKRNIDIQDEFKEITTINKLDDKLSWLQSALITRNDPEEAMKICEKASGVTFTNDDKKQWEELSKIRPPYAELIALTNHKNIEKYRSGMNVMEKIWAPVKEQRIAYAEINGIRLLERDQNIKEQDKVQAKKFMLEGMVPTRVMEAIGDGNSMPMQSFLYNKQSKETREALIARSGGRT